MARRKNIHVYNFGFFYLPSYQETSVDAYTDIELENGRLQAWEGELESSYNQEGQASNWPII